MQTCKKLKIEIIDSTGKSLIRSFSHRFLYNAYFFKEQESPPAGSQKKIQI